MKRLIIALLSMSVAACSVLAPKPDRTRNYLLSEQPSARGAGRTDLSLAIGPIAWPPYLDRSEIVTRVSPNKVALSPLDRWAEPLRDNFNRVFVSDLTSALGTDAVVEYPWYGVPEVDYRITLDVLQFEVRRDGVAVLVARWELRRGVAGAVIRAARTVREIPSEGSSTQKGVRALSQAVAELAEDIAAAIPAR